MMPRVALRIADMRGTHCALSSRRWVQGLDARSSEIALAFRTFPADYPQRLPAIARDVTEGKDP